MEAGISGVAGLTIGAIVGVTLTQVLVTILTAIFDPPPTHTVLPGNAASLRLFAAAGYQRASDTEFVLPRRQ